MSFTSRKSPYFSKSSQGTFHAQEIQSQLEAKGNFSSITFNGPASCTEKREDVRDA
jgi:hypothetical protein